MHVIARLQGVGAWIAKALAPFMIAAVPPSPSVAETTWAECQVTIRVHRSFLHREEIPFRIRYRVCHVTTFIHTYLPRMKRIVEPDEYTAFIVALAHMTAGEAVDHEPVLMVLAVVAGEQFRTLYDRPAYFLQREVIEPLALVAEGIAGERVNYHVVMLDEELFRSLEVKPFSPEPVAVRV
ncbi:MAG: hypothetical protein HY437_00740 [Candidatus Magasanikbacteria bacterium]|nr:hypothetical protein [Candidatus Magasanikbacteria bacterium]